MPKIIWKDIRNGEFFFADAGKRTAFIILTHRRLWETHYGNVSADTLTVGNQYNTLDEAKVAAEEWMSRG